MTLALRAGLTALSLLGSTARESMSAPSVAHPTPIPRIVHGPTYPTLMYDAGLEGRTTVELVVGRAGDVRAVRILDEYSGMLSDEARRSALQWQFEPLPAGQDSALFRLTMRFRMTGKNETETGVGWFYHPPDTVEIRVREGGMHQYDIGSSFPDARFENLDHMRESLAQVTSFRVFQGLPRAFRIDWPRCDPDSMILIRGFRFYSIPMTLSGDSAAEFVTILADSATFAPRRGPIKRCMGFHPDFAVEWTVDEQRHRALLCFGCNDMRYAGPEATVLCEIVSTTAENLARLLQPFAPHAPCSPWH